MTDLESSLVYSRVLQAGISVLDRLLLKADSLFVVYQNVRSLLPCLYANRFSRHKSAILIVPHGFQFRGTLMLTLVLYFQLLCPGGH